MSKHLSIVEARCRPFIEDDCFWRMAIEFSPAYFAGLKRELEANGHEVILQDAFLKDCQSFPIAFNREIWEIFFFINDRLPGESFLLQLL